MFLNLKIKTLVKSWAKPALLLAALLPMGCATANTSEPTEPQAQSNYERKVQINDFIAEMVKDHDFDPEPLEALFQKVERKQSILDAISRPAERTLEWKDYRKIFITKPRIDQGVTFLRQHRALLERAEMVYGIPKEVITAIIGVETFYGRMTGKYRVMDALSTLAFDYPPRAEFFRGQLKEYLLLAKEEGIDPLSLKGSYAGAMGFPQFIPSSYRAYAVDFDGDHQRNIWQNPADVIGSVANYFRQHGWETGAEVVLEASTEGDAFQSVLNQSLKPELSVADLAALGFTARNKNADIDANGKATAMQLEGVRGTEYWLGLKNFYVITRYNHSKLYAMAVYQLSQEIRKADLKR